ncbi:MAG: hypothetical protein QOH39_1559 [Verrucomicrobiota bacterium]|jgi:hypothetical protein
MPGGFFCFWGPLVSILDQLTKVQSAIEGDARLLGL